MNGRWKISGILFVASKFGERHFSIQECKWNTE
jgi:hypothetical protein